MVQVVNRVANFGHDTIDKRDKTGLSGIMLRFQDINPDKVDCKTRSLKFIDPLYSDFIRLDILKSGPNPALSC